MIARADAIDALQSEQFDVVVVGGGITGAGVAFDAATRGYSVALVERADFAAGTSSRSSKLVHGGLRYLQNFDLGLVREALLERQLMVALAPHLVHPLPLVVAAFDGARPDRLTGVGLNLYDVMTVERLRGRPRPRPRLRGRASSSRSSSRWVPPTPRSGAPSATASSPARRCSSSSRRSRRASRPPATSSTTARPTTRGSSSRSSRRPSASARSAPTASRSPSSCRSAGARPGSASATRRTANEFVVRAANVVNATGVWADRLRPDELHDEAEVPRIRPSRGTHITLRHEDLPLGAGGAIVPAGGGRTIFVLPWLGRSLVGTTDNDFEGTLDRHHVPPAEQDIAYLLDACNAYFETTLRPADLTGAYAGVRPLISTGDPKKSVDISRKAELYETSSGMVTITGGKLTTWRRMAKMTVDRLVERDARDAPCRTHAIPLGAAVDVADLPRVEGVPDAAYAALASRYGHLAHDVLTVAREDERLAAPIVSDLPDLLAEVVYAARREQARSLGDVLLRRTRLGAARGARAGRRRPGRRARRGRARRRAGLGCRRGRGATRGLARRGARRRRRRQRVTLPPLAG